MLVNCHLLCDSAGRPEVTRKEKSLLMRLMYYSNMPVFLAAAGHGIWVCSIGCVSGEGGLWLAAPGQGEDTEGMKRTYGFLDRRTK